MRRSIPTPRRRCGSRATVPPTAPRTGYTAGAMVGNSTRYRTSVADGGPDPPRPISLAPEYRRLIARLEDLPANASGADKSWVHRAHAAAIRHFASAKRR